jgi:hypothetical protein
VIRGIGLISCVYVNGETGQFWVIDYRLYDPHGDGQSKLDLVAAMRGRGGVQQALTVCHRVDG